MLLGVVLLVSLGSRPALALDPSKAITQYVQNAWTSKDGLPQNSVNTIIQTRDGYIWLGTQEGLVRFDGVKFRIFNKQNTQELKHNFIWTLCEDHEGNLWIGTNGGGLSRYKEGIFTSYGTNDGLSHDTIRTIVEDKDGALWLGTMGGGLDRFKDGKFKVYKTENGLSSNDVLALHEDRNGCLWIGTNGGGLSRLKKNVLTNYAKPEGLADNVVGSIFEDQGGTLWIGTGKGLDRLIDGKLTVFSMGKNSFSPVKAISQDREGNLWIGTAGQGVIRITQQSVTEYTTKNSLPSDFVMAFYEDRERSLWIGMDGGGLARLKDGDFVTYGTEEGLSYEIARTVYEGRDGSLWIGTPGNGLNRLKEGKNTLYTTHNGLSNDKVTTLSEDREGNLWIGTSGGGLNRLKNGRLTSYTTKQGLAHDSLRAIYEDSQGYLWIGTDGGGLSRLKDDKFTTYSTNEGLSSNIIFYIFEDSKKRLWIGTGGGGLNLYNNGKFVAYTVRDGLSNNFVTAIFEDREGVLWIGTSGGGLNRFKNGAFAACTAKDGLFDDTVYRIMEDDHGNLWMSSNKGVFWVSKKELNEFADGRIQSVKCESYDDTDGMKSAECNGRYQPSGWKTSDGRLWFPTLKGVVAIDPNNLKANALPPPVLIEQVIIDKQSINTGQSAQLAPGRKEFEFNYTGLSFLTPQKVKFKYKLEGFDKEWVDAGTRRTAYYTNISPGSYRFRVIACNNDGVWNETGATFEFYLQPHFYQTGWFYALCALMVMLAGFGLYRLRVRQLRQRTDELEEVVDQRTQELKKTQEKVVKLEKQATEQQMAGGFAHEMRNALAGPKLLLDQALALEGSEPQVSLNLSNCRNLKEIYLRLKNKLPEDETQVVLGKMQTIFVNEERINEVLQLVHKATGRGLKITQQIMDYSRIGQQSRGKQGVNIGDLIAGIIAESREEFLGQGVTFEYKPNGQPLKVIAEESHIYSIINNLILNARDALIDPGIRDRENRHIEITTSWEGNTCVVIVTDNGIGIPEGNLARIFEPFFSSKPATGTGLGLGMVKKMVLLYDGTIDVRSALGKGTSVTVSLLSLDREAS